MKQISGNKLLICDLDNTLYDWVLYFVTAFYNMVDKAIEILECDKDELLDDFQKVHQKYHDSERPFSLIDTEIVSKRFKGLSREQIALKLNPAFESFNIAREKHLVLYEGVFTTLEQLKNCGITLIAHTDSNLYGVLDRLYRLNIIDFFSKIYCCARPNSVHPNPERIKGWFEKFPMEKVVEMPKTYSKPNPHILKEICHDEGFSFNNTVYVGDSIARDILMAKRVSVFSVWAKYGSLLNTISYEKLVRITHWTSADVKNERLLKKEAENIRPDYVLERYFGEILKLFT